MPKFDRLLGFRGLVYVVLLVFLALIAPHVVLDGAAFSESQIFLITTLITLGQVLVLFFPLQSSSVLALFFCDATLFTVLVRVSGASSSPFLVMFPILAALGPVLFRGYGGFFLPLACLFFSGLALGWGVGILSVWTSVLAVSFLSFYLMKLLQKSDIALEKSEIARRRLENLQKVILANIPSGLVSIDSQGRIIQMNAVGQRILSVSEEEVLHKHFRDLVPALDIQKTAAMTLSSRNREIVEYMNPSHQFLKLGYSLAQLRDPEDDSILGTLFVFQDLTQVLKMEEDLRTSEKLAAIGKLAAGIAHEIRNPLAGISGSAQLLSSTSSVGAEDKQLLNIIQRESSRLDGLITEFLEYVRPPKLELRDVDLVTVCRQCVENISVNSKWLELNPDLKFSHPKEAIWVQGEPNKITQVVLNFLLNSAQAGAKNIEIFINQEALLEIRDNGSGISAENRKRLFEPFFTTKDKGTGLGLAISYKMIEAMGASIQVRSPAPDFCEKDGSIFAIQFIGSRK
jgi:two-component system, NtrC family, sensor histidine kinase PilS